MQKYALKSALVWSIVSLGPDLLTAISFSSFAVFAVFLLIFLASGYSAAYFAFRYMGARFSLCRNLGRNAGALTGLFSAIFALFVSLAQIYLLPASNYVDNRPFGMFAGFCLVPVLYLICGSLCGWMGGVVYYTQRRIISRR